MGGDESVVVLSPCDWDTLRQTDQPLYQVKKQGRNRVVIADGSGREINPA